MHIAHSFLAKISTFKANMHYYRLCFYDSTVVLICQLYILLTF